MRPLLLLCALGGAAVGCRTEPNPAYCDVERPCAPGFRCEVNTCIATGGDGGDCPTPCGGATPWCGASGQCVACLEAAHCPAQAPLCDPAGACVPCVGDEQCPVLSVGGTAGVCTA